MGRYYVINKQKAPMSPANSQNETENGNGRGERLYSDREHFDHRNAASRIEVNDQHHKKHGPPCRHTA